MDPEYRDMLFAIVRDPRFPGVERWQELLPPMSKFITQLVRYQLEVDALQTH
jgi:hypothetical protein